MENDLCLIVIMKPVSIINTGRAHEVFLQTSAREIVFLACKWEFEDRAVHIQGKNNILPDPLSRAHINDKYYQECQALCDNEWIMDHMPDDAWSFSCLW